MLKEKELKLFNPKINCVPEFGHLFSLLDMNDFVTETWVVNNFMHFGCFEDRSVTLKDQWTILGNCPLLETTTFYNASSLEKGDALKEFIIESLQSEYYVILNVNRTYISTAHGHTDYRADHLILINGFDLNDNVFMVSDNSSTTGKYMRNRYNIDEVIKGYNNILVDDSHRPNIIKTRLVDHEIISKFSWRPQFQFDLDYFIIQLNLVINTQGLSFFHGACAYNLEAVSYEVDQLKLSPNDEISTRSYYMYFEHVSILCNHIEYLVKCLHLNKDSEIIANFLKLKRRYETTLFLAIKYNIARQRSVIEKVIHNLTICVEEERTLITELIKEITVVK